MPSTAPELYPIYKRFCRLFCVGPRAPRSKALTVTEANTLRVDFARHGLDDSQILAYVCSLMRTANVPSTLVTQFLHAYLLTANTSGTAMAVRSALDTASMQDLLSYNAQIAFGGTRMKFSFWHFEGNSFSGEGAAIIIAAAVILGDGLLELDLSNCPEVHDVDMTGWVDFIERARLRNRNTPFGLRGLRMDGCPIRTFARLPAKILTELRWLSLKGTAFRNLWTTASVIAQLPNLRAILIRGDPKSVIEFEHVRLICADSPAHSSNVPDIRHQDFSESLVSTAQLAAHSSTPAVRLSSSPVSSYSTVPSASRASSSGTVLPSARDRQPVSQPEANVTNSGSHLKRTDTNAVLLEKARLAFAPGASSRVPDEIPYLPYLPETMSNEDWMANEDSSPVSRVPHYRHFLLAHALPALVSLDGLKLNARESDNARRDIVRHFDLSISDSGSNYAPLHRQLRNRELETSNSHAVLWAKSRSSMDSNPKRRRNANYDQIPDGAGLKKVSAVHSGLASMGAKRLVRSRCRVRALEAFSAQVFKAVNEQSASFGRGLFNDISSQAESTSRKRPVGSQSSTAYVKDKFFWTDFEKESSRSLLSRSGQPRINYVCEPQDCPRQFEYNPIDPRKMVFGTEDGHLVVMDQDTDKVIGSCATGGGRGHIPPGNAVRTSVELPALLRDDSFDHSIRVKDSVLGISWFNKDVNRFIAGAESGKIHVYNVEWMGSGENGGCSLAAESFPRLTSIHTNSTDERFIVSGYDRDVGLFDLDTGRELERIKDCHADHINVLKFAHGNPHIFVTSSFDRFVKKWDLRESRPGGGRRPIFQRKSDSGNVMVVFSPDDEYLLVSAVNNEVKQYSACDGRLERAFNIPKTKSEHNYTRSYYMNGSEYIISGSCSEDVVRVYNAKTGQFFKEVEMDTRKGHRANGLYVQSLRANPRQNFNFSALLSMRGRSAHLVLARVDLHARALV